MVMNFINYARFNTSTFINISSHCHRMSNTLRRSNIQQIITRATLAQMTNVCSSKEVLVQRPPIFNNSSSEQYLLTSSYESMSNMLNSATTWTLCPSTSQSHQLTSKPRDDQSCHLGGYHLGFWSGGLRNVCSNTRWNVSKSCNQLKEFTR